MSTLNGGGSLGQGEEDFHANLNSTSHLISHCGVSDSVPSSLTHPS